MTESGPHENPLVPNSKLRQMYVAMVEARILDEHVAGLQRGVKPRRRLSSTRGQEACRVSTAIELGAGDLVSDAAVGVGMELLLGANVDSVRARLAALTSGTKKRKEAPRAETQILPWIEDVSDRLRVALGAALALKRQKQGKIVVAYAGRGDAGRGVWKEVFALAARLELPIIFVVLPGAGTRKKKGDAGGGLSVKSRASGVPGIPVDASDAVALYRVAQESIGRARAGDGPVLIECAQYPLDGRRSEVGGDPIARMRSFLVERKVCSETWLDEAGETFRKRIAAKR